MKAAFATPDDYVAGQPEDRRAALEKLRAVIRKNLPKGFAEEMNYGMIGYVVPHSLYPAGYHCDPKLPLPFMSIASQKGFIAVYHMGIYADAELMAWFLDEHAKLDLPKLDMGKSCIRFKKPEAIPFALIGKLAAKTTPKAWIAAYEKAFKQRG
jgi:hypothetical protein